jgi:prefoldin subunit 5
MMLIPQGSIVSKRVFDEAIKQLTERIEKLEKQLESEKRTYTKRSEKWTKADSKQ